MARLTPTLFWAHFWCMSTGYVQGSKPPRFEAEARRPIPACGTDAYIRIYGTRPQQLRHARDVCRRRGYLGFSVETLGVSAVTIRGYEAVSKLEEVEA